MTGAPPRFRSLDVTYPLLGRTVTGVLTTVAPDGRLQVTPVWFLVDGGCVLVSTMREFAKARNMRDRPVAALLVIDPEDASEAVGGD